MGAGHSRKKLLEYEESILKCMNIDYESFDVMIPVPTVTKAEDKKESGNSSSPSTPRTTAASSSPSKEKPEQPMEPIRTLLLRATGSGPKQQPVVILHGYACGIAIFYKFLPLLQKRVGENRDIYCFDLLGMGASGRPDFNLDDPVETEEYFTKSVHSWVEAVGMSTPMVLLGHSFGGYVCTGASAQDCVLRTHVSAPGFPRADSREDGRPGVERKCH